MPQTIHVVGLGPGPAHYLTLETHQLLTSELPIYLRTSVHPTVQELREWGCIFTSFDSFYEQASDFESLYDKITAQLIAEVEAQEKIIYAVPGHPLVAESTVTRLLEATQDRDDIEVKVHTAVSCLDVIFESLELDPTDNVSILDALNLEHLDHRYPLIITQVYSQAVANEAKLALLERLEPEFEIQVIRAAGCEDERNITIPLAELDRLEWIDHLTSVYVPASENIDHLNPLERLRAVVAQLRNPDGGCPWDLEQDHLSLRKYLMEESYEVLSAIDAEDPDALCEELGDLLLQVYLQSQVAQDHDEFDLDEVADGISDKLIYRHPHVFGDSEASTPEEVKAQWEALKAQEKAEQNSVLDDLPQALPALQLAAKIQHKVAQVGFDWPQIEGVLDKLKEEYDELLEVIENKDKEGFKHEFGDLLFVLANLARWHKEDPELILRQANERFTQRFQYMEGLKTEEKPSLEAWETLWQQAKETRP